MRRTTALLASALLLAACGDGGSGDAGPPDATLPAIGLSVVSAELGASTRPGHVLLNLNVKVDANDEGPLAVAAAAFTVILSSSMRVSASQSLTDARGDGCTSRSVPLGSSATCVAVFEIMEDATPVTLEWSDGTRTRTTALPTL